MPMAGKGEHATAALAAHGTRIRREGCGRGLGGGWRVTGKNRLDDAGSPLT